MKSVSEYSRLRCLAGVKSGFPGSLIILNLRLILGWGESTLAFNSQGVPKCVPAFKLLYDPPVRPRPREGDNQGRM